MTKRSIIVALAFVLLAAACGSEGGRTSVLAEQVTPEPEATTTPAASPATTEAAATPTAAGGAAPAPGGGQTQTTKPASEGGVNAPKDGRYTYTYKGEATDPFNPAAPPQKFDGEQTVESSHQGNVYTSQTTNTETPGRFTTRTRWEPTRILLLAYKTETAGGDFNCTFDPPLVIAKVPIRAEKFPTQQFKGTGNACDGKIDIEFQRQEPMKDATGRSWSTWRVHVKLQVGNEQFTSTSDETQWFSPELGTEIKTDGTTNGEVRTPGGSQKFSGKSTSVLKSHP